METLPLFLDMMVPAYLAILLSVTCVLFFGEYVIMHSECARRIPMLPYRFLIGFF